MVKLAAAFALILTATTFAEMPYGTPTTLPIGGSGGWDYLTVSPDGKSLYVPRSTHTQVIDPSTGKILGDVPGQQRNHGVAIAPDLHRGFITDGKDASVTIFDTESYKVLGKIHAADDADGIIFDPSSNKVLLSCGDAGALVTLPANIDPQAGKADAPIALGGKPEFLAADRQGKAYVNLEDKGEIAVVDLKAGTVLHHWPVAPDSSPVGLAIDAEHHHLFVGCRKPQMMIIMSTEDGKVLAELPIGAGVDATAFDDGYAMASCRDGTLTIIKETSPDHFEVVQTVQTHPGARTMGVDHNTHTVYLPAADFLPSTGKGRPAAKPDSFMIVVVPRMLKSR